MNTLVSTAIRCLHHIPPSHLFCPRVRPRVESVRLGLAVILGLFLISSDAVFAQGGMWVTKAPMPTARSHVMTEGIEGKLYVVGGLVGCCDNALNILEVYDPVTNTWTSLAPMPTARYVGGAAAINGKLYVVGGDTAPFEVTGKLEVYDPAANTWSAKAPMPTARAGLQVEVINGLLYAVGGNDLGS